jgi:hypothetical protein
MVNAEECEHFGLPDDCPESVWGLQPDDDDHPVDDLIASTPAFRALVEKSKAGASKPFPVPEKPGD